MMSRLVPKLRFKEFSGEWEEKSFGDIVDIYNGSTPKTSILEYWNGDINWITPAEMGQKKYISSSIRKITSKGLENCNTKLLPINSVILSCRAPIGYVAINKEKMSFNQGCKGILPQKIYYEFLYYLLKILKSKLENLGSGNTFKEISTNNLKSMEVVISKDKKEQQKIANTLSSLDALIEAQNQKVEALKKHKKGLMQQLFPSEGERVPKLRFKEFCKFGFPDSHSGEWEENLISKFFKTYSGGTPSTTNKSYYGGSIPFIRSAEINKYETELYLTNEGIKNSSAKLVKKGTLLYALYGANSGDVAISKIDGAINQAVLCLDSEKASNPFLYYNLTNLKTKIINRYIQGGQGNLSGDIIKSLPIAFPKDLKEQQKIANTLSSLDALIEAQNQKVEALKKHKKGLMQQMFVSGQDSL